MYWFPLACLFAIMYWFNGSVPATVPVKTAVNVVAIILTIIMGVLTLK